jgi:hypothetical protein
MIMKKLIAIAVVFALAVGGVFAADVGATVFSGVNVMKGNTEDDSKIMGSGEFFRLRFEASGENDDGNFGAWIRLEPGQWWGDIVGLAWWKPIDMFKMTIGGNPDSIYGKEGYAGWMFYQMPSDVGIVNAGNVWGGGYIDGGIFRDAFYGGFGSNGLMLDIMPADIFAAHLIFPYFNGGELATIFKRMTAQLDFNLDFGNIALTFELGESAFKAVDPDKFSSKIFLYFGLSAIENLSLDVGIGFKIPESYELLGIKATKMTPLAAGLAVKFDVNDSFGLKARLLAEFMGKTTMEGYGQKQESTDPFVFGLDLLPYIGISDNLKVFIGLGINMKGGYDDYMDVEVLDDDGEVLYSDSVKYTVDSKFGWYFNPYLQVGAEWGPTFYAGIRVWSAGGEKAPINFEIPIGIQVSF